MSCAVLFFNSMKVTRTVGYCCCDNAMYKKMLEDCDVFVISILNTTYSRQSSSFFLLSASKYTLLGFISSFGLKENWCIKKRIGNRGVAGF